MTRTSAGLLAALLILTLARPSGSGGISETIPTDWVAATRGPGAEIVQFIKDLPHDASPLGLRAAHQRTKPTPVTFRAVRFTATDGTPLAGILGLGLNADTTPRPGIVLVPGFTQTTNHKYIVELADLFQRNGWNVLAIDLRGHGVSRTLSSAMITGGWKEAGDIIGAVRFLKATSQTSSVAVIGFSDGGRALVKGMASDGGQDISAGIAVTAPLGPTTPVTPPPPGTTPSPLGQFFLNFLGTSSEYEYYDRAARSYGVDLRTMEARTVADTDIAQVKTPLLLLYAMISSGSVTCGRANTTAAVSACPIGTGSPTVSTCGQCWSIEATTRACSISPIRIGSDSPPCTTSSTIRLGMSRR